MSFATGMAIGIASSAAFNSAQASDEIDEQNKANLQIAICNNQPTRTQTLQCLQNYQNQLIEKNKSDIGIFFPCAIVVTFIICIVVIMFKTLSS